MIYRDIVNGALHDAAPATRGKATRDAGQHLAGTAPNPHARRCEIPQNNAPRGIIRSVK